MQSLLVYDWVTCAALAAWLGSRQPKRWKMRAMLCVGIGLAGFAASYPLMIVGARLGYDVALAEDYINGESIRSALVELLVATAWSFFWFGAGFLAPSFWRRIAGSIQPVPPS